MKHIPILCDEIKQCLSFLEPGHVIDCTFGMGGHTQIFLELGWTVTAFDRDESVLQYLPISDNFTFINDKFSNIYKYNLNADLIFADIGMSTMQLEGHRGFSYKNDEPLDMRMGLSEYKVSHALKYKSRVEITDILRKYTDLRSINRYVSNIEAYRSRKDILTTFDLIEAVGTKSYKELSQIFQAFRIDCNQEIYELDQLLKYPSKNKLIITFHSIEDRIVKHAFKQYNYHGFILPSNEEILNNSKASCAKLRYGLEFYK